MAYERISTSRKRRRNQKKAYEMKFIGYWDHFEKVSILTLVTEDSQERLGNCVTNSWKAT